MLVYVLSVVCFLLLGLLSLSVYRIIQLVDVQTTLEVQVEESLDVLDRAYRDITAATMTEVFSDEPVVRRVVQALKDSQQAVLLVANKLVAFGDSNDEAVK